MWCLSKFASNCAHHSFPSWHLPMKCTAKPPVKAEVEPSESLQHNINTHRIWLVASHWLFKVLCSSSRSEDSNSWPTFHYMAALFFSPVPPFKDSADIYLYLELLFPLFSTMQTAVYCYWAQIYSARAEEEVLCFSWCAINPRVQKPHWGWQIEKGGRKWRTNTHWDST